MAEGQGGGVLVCPVGGETGQAEAYPDAGSAVRARPEAERWVWRSTPALYERVLEAGCRVERCYDVEDAETLLLAHEGMAGLPRGLPAAYARLRGLPVPEDAPPRAAAEGEPQPSLFDTGAPGPALPEGTDPLTALREVYDEQQRRIARTGHPGRMALLIAAESAGMLVAAEMGRAGLPWRADVHDALLTELLGGRYPGGLEPPRLARLAEEVSQAFGRRVRPDLPADVLKAFAQAGVKLTSTRKWELQSVDHPAVAPLLEYKRLYRLHTAHGWQWLRTWVGADGRFRPEYTPGGTVSGRWTTNGGGALQIPKVIRRAVIADPGWRLVVADADQMEPRVLAAVSRDRGLMEVAGGERDLYAALADRAFPGDRAQAKLALLGAIYGQTSGDALKHLADLRRRFPAAVAYVDDAARAGEEGRLVRTHLGRTCPPSGAADSGEAGLPQEEDAAPAYGTTSAARARGRFTRNYVVQGSAADWALLLLAGIRQRLHAAGLAGELVFFQHDEVIVHCPAGEVDAVRSVIDASAAEATRIAFGDIPVRFPFTTAAVECYADAK
ncbi:bifunctional 3'-5' exonuclease/DNA polymerase [Streptomyces sp. NPDC051940]|uniref:bifunctional 3'-5' exonuclease/DNA polymerase n=1 Tax=Streptomyces sp. NPDC051940 TaxID=3155675 RepID=UPI0034406F5D